MALDAFKLRANGKIGGCLIRERAGGTHLIPMLLLCVPCSSYTILIVVSLHEGMIESIWGGYYSDIRERSANQKSSVESQWDSAIETPFLGVQ